MERLKATNLARTVRKDTGTIKDIRIMEILRDTPEMEIQEEDNI
jgi:hypothetical protein